MQTADVVSVDTDEIKHQAELTAVLAEAPSWLEIQALDAEQTLDVYLDLKSPHAFIAIRPCLEVMRDYRVRVNFLPYTMGYEGLGITTSVGPDMKRRPPNAHADRRARMFYTAAREYAALQGLPFRTPHRLLDSTLAHRCFLFAREQNREVPFIMHAYLHGWGSGWRNYELESREDLEASLRFAGVPITGLDEYVADGGPAAAAIVQLNKDAENAGYVGIPHLVFTDPGTGRQVGIFGREHLALVRSKFHRAGLARRPDVSPEFSHAWAGPR